MWFMLPPDDIDNIVKRTTQNGYICDRMMKAFQSVLKPPISVHMAVSGAIGAFGDYLTQVKRSSRNSDLHCADHLFFVVSCVILGMGPIINALVLVVLRVLGYSIDQSISIMRTECWQIYTGRLEHFGEHGDNLVYRTSGTSRSSKGLIEEHICGRMMKAFQAALKRYPLTFQMAASGVIGSGGDCFTQVVIEKRSKQTYEVHRTCRFFLLASCVIAPLAGRWFLLLEKVPGPKKLVPFLKVCIDQLVMGPIINAVVLIVLRVLERYPIDQSILMMKRDWWEIYISSLTVWPVAQMVNFYVVPLSMRVIFVQFVALFWNAYVSFKTQKKLHERDFDT